MPGLPKHTRACERRLRSPKRSTQRCWQPQYVPRRPRQANVRDDNTTQTRMRRHGVRLGVQISAVRTTGVNDYERFKLVAVPLEVGVSEGGD